MKKFLVMLLAVSMVLSMTVALASCSEDKPETSTDASEEVSTEASKEDSKEDSKVESKEDSTDAPSADASTDVTSEETTEEPSSEDPSSAAPAIEYKTSAAGTNYAKTATYTTSREGDTDPANIYLSFASTTDWADVDHTKLNDGVVGDCSTYDPSSAAMKGVTVQFAGTDKAFEFVWDLGDHYGDIKSIVCRQARHGTPNGNNRGFEVKLVQVSDDGINWTRAKGTLTSLQVAGAVEIADVDKENSNVEHFDFTYTLDAAAQGKFVKVVLSNDGGYVLQFEEMEIRN